ncbi:MAG: magnesium transporter [Microlunatus sp.]|nr:magnesium transporter [Microlunatus sp.]
MDHDLSALVREGDLRAVQMALSALHDVPAVVDELERQDAVTRAVAFRSLPKDLAVEVFEDLDPSLQSELITQLREEAGELVLALDPDDRVGMLGELPAFVARRLLDGLDADERAKTTALLGYPPDSVGRRMTPNVVSLPAGLSVGAALDRVREQEPDAETIYVLPVIGPTRRMIGVVSLRRLLVTDPMAAVTDVMREPILVHATDGQEDAARVVRDHGAVAVPVVDGEDRVLGLFTVDDAMRVLEQEESEDLARTGGAEPLSRPYLATSVLGLVRSRIVWLLILVVAAMLTVNVLDYFEDTLVQVVALALFVPFLIGTGGNAGAQAATTVVRAMAVGDARFRDLGRVVGKEVLTGFLLGIGLGCVAFVAAAAFVGTSVATVVALALIVVCTLATTAGSLTPMLARRAGVDPAVVSAPFITTFVDASGLVVYFLIARAVLGL